MTQNDDYVLVKDKQGNLKYYKDGKFFDIEEIDTENRNEPANQTGPSFGGKTENRVKESEEKNKKVGTQMKDDKFGQKIDDIIAELKINFTDPDIEKRFRNLVGSRLRGIRDEKELKYMMGVDKNDGGLGLDGNKADLILAVIRKHQAPKTQPEKVQPRKIEVDHVKLGNTGMADTAIQQKNKVDTALKQKTKEGINKKQDTKELLRPDITKPVIPLPEEKYKDTNVQNKKPMIRSGEAMNGKQQTDDVKFKPQLMGPIEELKTLDLENFRRMSVDPMEIISELEEKITLLREEDFAKGQQGIKAWQASPVYQLYTQMGIDSLMTGKVIKDVIVDRQIKNLPTLSQTEFEAIIKLNKILSS